MKSCFIFGEENPGSQMNLYGKHMLYTGDVYDFDGRVAKIDAITKEDCERAISLNFDAASLAAAAVGQIDRPLAL